MADPTRAEQIAKIKLELQTARARRMDVERMLKALDARLDEIEDLITKLEAEDA